MAYGHSFVVTALKRTGQGLVPQTTQFRWDVKTRTAPIDDIELELLLKTSRETPPGSSRPVEQVISASWEPTTLHGEWNDKFAGSGFAMATYVAFAQFVGLGPLVRLQYGPLSLVGILRRLKLTYQRDNCVGWEVEFSPHIHETVGEPASLGAVAPPTTRPMQEHAAIVQQSASDLQDQVSSVTDVPTSDGSIASVVDRMTSLLAATATVVASSAAGIESDAARKLLQLAGQFRAVGAASESLIATLSGVSGIESAAFVDPIAELRLDEWARLSSANARTLQLQSLEAEQDMIDRANAKPLAVYRPKAGESPYSISRRFYGTPNDWRLIWDYNSLDTLVLDGTEELTIPQRQA